MTDQLVAGYATNDFWMGFFPLSPIGMNFTDMTESVPSLLASLADEGHTPSRSWAYSAGAYYQDPPAPASLTLGGYDEVKIGGRSLEVPFGADQSRDLAVWLQSITYDTYGSSALLIQGVYMFIDSVVAHLWLPLAVCRRFEQAFNLTWDNATELYLIDDAVHAALVEQNPTFSFLLSESEEEKDPITITIPYAAFDLNISAPAANGTYSYFPLKRAANESQFVLGRVFLQEAYVIADYDRRNFSVSQVAFSHDDGFSRIVDIKSPNNTLNGTDGENAGDALSAGATAGIVIGCVVLLAITIAIYLWLRRRRSEGSQSPGLENTKDIAENSTEKAGDDGFLPEMDVNGHAVHEAGCGFGAMPEMQDSGDHAGRHELSAIGIIPEVEGGAASELASDRPLSR